MAEEEPTVVESKGVGGVTGWGSLFTTHAGGEREEGGGMEGEGEVG